MVTLLLSPQDLMVRHQVGMQRQGWGLMPRQGTSSGEVGETA